MEKNLQGSCRGFSDASVSFSIIDYSELLIDKFM